MIIKMENIKKSYKDKYNETKILENLNLTVEKGQLLSIIGTSGCGKSTLLNIIATIDKFDSGIYEFCGKNINSINEKEKSTIRNTKIGIIYQNFALIDSISVLENIMIPLKIRKINRKKNKEVALKALEQVNLKSMENKKIYELSGGEKQRVAIARTIAQNTDVILADEPTGSLDLETGKEIINILLELNAQGKTVIIVTHDLEIAQICDRKLMIKDGELKEASYNY